MTDAIAGPVSFSEREAYATLYYRGPATAEEIEVYSGMSLDEEIESLLDRGIIYANGNEYDVSDPNLSPNQLEAR